MKAYLIKVFYKLNCSFRTVHEIARDHSDFRSKRVPERDGMTESLQNLKINSG